MRSSVRGNANSVQHVAVAPVLARCAGAALLLLACGCTTIGYFGQAAVGQFDLWRRQQPLAATLARADLPAQLRSKLQLVVAARAFAQTHLALADDGSYHSYVDLGRDYVVWNVFAAPALALTPLKSCFLLIGCVEYRGFFHQAQAQAYAADLQRQGYDTFVGGVAAYSTLGWLDDPILSSVLRWDDVRIAETLFHELAHHRLYIADDATFNESFAMAVARIGVDLWLADDTARRIARAGELARERAFIGLLLEFRGQLAVAFAAPVPAAERRANKDRLYDELRSSYAALKASWGGAADYDAWMARDLNNAKLVSLATYHADVEAFVAVLKRRCDSDFPRFYALIRRLAALAPAARAQCLAALAVDSEPSAPHCAALLR